MLSRSSILCASFLTVAAVSTFLYADTIYIGDVPDQEKEVEEGTIGPDTASGGNITYAFFSNPYTNESGAPRQALVTEVNFWSIGEGTLTPFVAKFKDGDGAAADSYDVVAVGDPIETDFDLNNAKFKIGGATAVVEIGDGEMLIGGFHQTAGLIPWEEPAEIDGDYLHGDNVIPDSGPLEAEAAWSDLGREYRFNIALEFDVSDEDGDGLPDDWESANGLDPEDDGSTDVNNGPEGDPDGDTLNNLQEFQAGTHPMKADTDEDTLPDNEELSGAGSRPPTNPLLKDTDKDELSDLFETNTGVFASKTDTGSNPTLRDTDEDTINDGDEVAGNNDDNFTSDPNLADTDGDKADDPREIAHRTDPNDKEDFPAPAASIIIGDVEEVDEGTIGPDGANGGDITYAFFENAYINESGRTQKLQVGEVNFWSINEGTLIPYVALYNGDGGELGENYDVLAVGDGIEGEPGLNTAPFSVDGKEVTIKVKADAAVIAGFHQTGSPGMVPWESPGDSDGDYIQSNNLLPDELPGPLLDDAGWSDLGREYRFNISLEEGSVKVFQILNVDYNATTNQATVTWTSQAGADYAVDAGEDLEFWIELDDGIIGEAEQTSFVDDSIPADARRRYYRVRQL